MVITFDEEYENARARTQRTWASHSMIRLMRHCTESAPLHQPMHYDVTLEVGLESKDEQNM